MWKGIGQTFSRRASTLVSFQISLWKMLEIRQSRDLPWHGGETRKKERSGVFLLWPGYAGFSFFQRLGSGMVSLHDQGKKRG